jgi:phosphoribosylglycinamide formyltransferase 1
VSSYLTVAPLPVLTLGKPSAGSISVAQTHDHSHWALPSSLPYGARTFLRRRVSPLRPQRFNQLGYSSITARCLCYNGGVNLVVVNVCTVAAAVTLQPQRYAVLLSGQGSNAKALFAAQQQGRLPWGHLALVVSNKRQAPGLAWAEAQSLPTLYLQASQHANRLAADAWLVAQLQAQGIEALVLAGYNRILTAPLLSAFTGRILNIHPSLLPRHGGVGMVGLAVHQAVIAAGDTFSGCSVHLVTPEVDAGPLLGQASVPVYPTDTPEQLALRVQRAEHRLYPAVLAQWLSQQQRLRQVLTV